MSRSRRPEIDWLRSDDLPELQAFIERHWRQGHVLARDERLLRWQYDHPARDDLVSVLAAHAGARLAGFLGLVQTPFTWLGERRSGAWLAMWSVDPDARRHGLGLALLVESLRRFDVVACVGFNETAARIFGGVGFDVRPALPQWVRALDAGAFERLVGRPAIASEPTPPPSVRVVEWGEDAAVRWDACWERLATGLVGAVRDADFVRGRYAEHPAFRYVIRLAEGPGGDVTALCVHRIEAVRDSGECVIRLVELLGDPGAAAGLAARALEDGPDAALADFFCASPELGRPLERLGFVRADTMRRPPPHRFQPLEAGRPLAGAFWRKDGGGGAFAGVPLYATRGDGDQDRPG